MAYSTITNSEIAVGAPVTNSLMTKLRDNPEAIALGLSGATRIVDAAIDWSTVSGSVGQTQIASSAFGQGELKSTTASQSTSISETSYAAINPAGGSYTLGYFLGGGQSSSPRVIAANGGTYAATVGIYNWSGAATVYIYSRYIQASPPYNLGYGDIPRFIMAQIDKSTGDVIGTYSAEDPPWAYHGPHDCHPINSILLRSAGLWGVNISEAMKSDPDATLEKLKAMRDLRQDKKRLLQAKKDHAMSVDEKNIDMDIVPHLFSNFDPDKHVAVMLDPCCSLTEKLALEDEFTGHEFSISNLLHDGYLKIDNDSLPVNRTPAGVLTVGYRLKGGR